MDRATRRALIRLTGAAASLLFGIAAACGAPDRGVRVVLITLDTVRYDAFAGDRLPSSLPKTAEWARRGTWFSRAYAASNVTQPTHASLFTALHPWEHAVTRNGQVLADGFETVAEVLGASGFRTGAVVASFPLGKRFGFAQGFDVYREVFRLELVRGVRTWEGVEIPAGAFYSLADEVIDEALALLDDLEAERQFVWIHLFDGHDPYGDTIGQQLGLNPLWTAREAGGEFFDAVLRDAARLYHADLVSLDAALGRLLDRIERDAGRFETHVVLTADHGESFGEGGHVGHGYSLGPQEIRVPLVIASPRLPAGVREDVTGSIDVRATLLSLAGVADEGGRGRDLTSSAPVEGDVAFGMQQSAPAGSREASARERFFAAQRGSVYAGNADGLSRVDGDPGDLPEPLTRRLRELFGGFESEARRSSGEDLHDEETRRALEALGYAR
jgi:arylsulfatase A-like enzyme